MNWIREKFCEIACEIFSIAITARITIAKKCDAAGNHHVWTHGLISCSVVLFCSGSDLFCDNFSFHFIITIFIGNYSKSWRNKPNLAIKSSDISSEIFHKESVSLNFCFQTSRLFIFIDTPLPLDLNIYCSKYQYLLMVYHVLTLHFSQCWFILTSVVVLSWSYSFDSVVNHCLYLSVVNRLTV